MTTLQSFQRWYQARSATVGRAGDRGEMIEDNFIIYPVIGVTAAALVVIIKIKLFG